MKIKSRRFGGLGALACASAAVFLALAAGWAPLAHGQQENRVVVTDLERVPEAEREAVDDSDAPANIARFSINDVMDVDARTQNVVLRIDPGIGPVDADDILAARLLMEGELFPENVNLKLVDGEIYYSPRPDLGPGAYNLIVETGTGITRVGFYIKENLPEDTLDRQMRVLDMRDRELIAALRFLPGPHTAELNLNISPSYHIGQVVVIERNIDPDNWYSWTVDGKEVMYGQGPHTFVHAFKELGTDVIMYSERFGDVIERVGLDVVQVLPRR